jgi:hypothetical protein
VYIIPQIENAQTSGAIANLALSVIVFKLLPPGASLEDPPLPIRQITKQTEFTIYIVSFLLVST